MFISAGHFSIEVHWDSSSEQFVIIWVTGNEEPFLALLHEPYYSLGCCHSGFNPFCTYNNYSLIKNRKCMVEKRKCSALLSFNISFCTSLLEMSLSQHLDCQDTSFLIFWRLKMHNNLSTKTSCNHSFFNLWFISRSHVLINVLTLHSHKCQNGLCLSTHLHLMFLNTLILNLKWYTTIYQLFDIRISSVFYISGLQTVNN